MKKITILSILFLLLTVHLLSGYSKKMNVTQLVDSLTKGEMQSVIEFLGHDLLEGRAPGTRGGDVSEIYMRSLFKLIGLAPGESGKYIQPFDLIGYTINELNVELGDFKLKYIDDIVGSYTGSEKKFDIKADTVFIGFGTKTDLWKWDDFKGVSIKNKIVIVRVNDPGMYNNSIFEGKKLTYFGRWTYHIEEAAKRKALGILLIHTDKSAGYGWGVVKNSWTGEQPFFKSVKKRNLKFSAWIKEKKLKEFLIKRNIKLEDLYKKSLNRGFRPIDLGFKTRIKGHNSIRLMKNSNVVGMLRGRTNKSIVISAHLDHLGKDINNKDDKIYNGAIDNGSAVASMVITAKLLKKIEKDLYYSVIFLACNSEESGLFGSKYFAGNANKDSLLCNINFESTPVWDSSDTIMGIGARFSTFENMLKIVAKKMGIGYSEFSMENQGFFYRSDQFPFARNNIPSVWISAGEREITGKTNYKEFWKKRYHTVQDEYDPSWKLDGMKQTIKVAMLLIEHINKRKDVPKWKRALTFPINK